MIAGLGGMSSPGVARMEEEELLECQNGALMAGRYGSRWMYLHTFCLLDSLISS